MPGEDRAVICKMRAVYEYVCDKNSINTDWVVISEAKDVGVFIYIEANPTISAVTPIEMKAVLPKTFC